MALPLSNSFEGGTNGTAITPANSGGASGTAFPIVTAGTGATVTYSSVNPAHGTLCGLSTVGSTGASAFVAWSGAALLGGPPANLWGRAYFNVAVAPGNGDGILRFWNVENNAFLGALTLNTNLSVSFQNGAFATPFISSAGLVKAGTWWRVEWGATFTTSSANAQLTARWYTAGADSVTPTATYVSPPTANLGSHLCNEVDFGWAGGNANQPNLAYDSLNVNGTGFPGPATARGGASAVPALIASGAI